MDIHATITTKSPEGTKKSRPRETAGGNHTRRQLELQALVRNVIPKGTADNEGRTMDGAAGAIIFTNRGGIVPGIGEVSRWGARRYFKWILRDTGIVDTALRGQIGALVGAGHFVDRIAVLVHQIR